MVSETIFNTITIIGCCTGVFLFLTVLLTANNFINAGTVGKVSVTFYCLGCFNACMWVLYGTLLGSIAIIGPNMWAVFTTTFALFSYFSVLGKEAAAAKARAAADGGASAAVVEVEKKDDGATRSVDLKAIAAEFDARFAESKKTFVIVESINACCIAVIILAFFFGFESGATSIAGTAAVIMATLLFTGPLDQVSWILKNKNAIPLDPLMTIVGLANAFIWATYGVMTNDFFVILPNCVAVVLCALQVGLIAMFPRTPVVVE